MAKPGDKTVQQILTSSPYTITQITDKLPGAGAGIVYDKSTGNLHVTADWALYQLSQPNPFTINIGMALADATAISNLMASSVNQLMIGSLGAGPPALNSLNITATPASTGVTGKVPLTGLSGLLVFRAFRLVQGSTQEG